MDANPKLTTVKMTLEYNGAAFAGWQEQPGLRTIQGELARVLEVILRCPALELTASGRTDAGVHARGQVVSFKTAADSSELGSLGYGVTSLLRGEVSVLDTTAMPDHFNARFSKHYKQYVYRIFKRLAAPILDKDFVWHVKRPLNIALMSEQSREFIGRHDFSSFRAADCVASNPVRTIYESEIVEHGDEVHYRVVAPGFLKQMVRNIAGTLVGIGMGRLSSSIPEILDRRDRGCAGVTAPAHGLSLDWVRYGEYGKE